MFPNTVIGLVPYMSKNMFSNPHMFVAW